MVQNFYSILERKFNISLDNGLKCGIIETTAKELKNKRFTKEQNNVR